MLPSEALLRGREIKFPTRRSYGCLALAFTAFAVYGSLLPADFHSIPLNAAWDHFTTSILTVPSSRVSRTDVLANVLLFVPIGFTLAGSLLLDRGRRFAFRAVGVILPSSVAVSLATEFLQTFTESRVPSIIDVTAQTAGCVVGVGAWMALGDSITTWCRATLAATGGDRLFRILSAYTVGWIFINLAPFDITVDLSDLLGRLRSGRIAFTPFAGSNFPSMRFAWDAFAEFVSAAPLGVLWIVSRHAGGRRSGVAGFCFGAAIVAIVEMSQAFIASHSAIATDVIFGWAGVGAGAWIWTRRASPASPAEETTDGISLPAMAAAAFWLLVLCAYHWLPYDFIVDVEAIKRKLASISLLPFTGYRSGSDLQALSTLVTKLAVAAPLGIAFAFVSRGMLLSRRIALAGWMLIAAAVFGAIEAGQMFLPTRVPDPTDVLVGMIGTYAGLSVGYWLEK